MLPRGWELILRGAMEDAGLAKRSASERRRVAETVAGRLELHGVTPELRNWGGVLCGRPVHTGCCKEVGGRRLQRFELDSDGAQRLIELCCLYTGAVEVGGFRSEVRSEGFFGPNADAERTFQELSAAWAGLEAEVGSAKLRSGIAKESYETWIAFRDKWQSGDADTTALAALAADVNMTRQNLGRAAANIHVPDVTQTTAALKTATSIDSAARDAAKSAENVAVETWRSVPLSVKLGAAAVAVLGLLLALLRVTR